MALIAPIDQLLSSLKQVSFYQPVLECVTNSLEANARNISVELFSSLREGTAIKDDFFVEKVIVSDDGEGFNDANFISFKNYRTKKKIHLGCKGVGRLIWLKIFKKAEIVSVVNEGGVHLKKSFIFDETFDFAMEPDIEEVTSRTKRVKTSVILSEIKDEDKRVPEDLEKLRDKVLIELLPKLLLHESDFKITFKSNRPGVKDVLIANKDLPILAEKSFTVTVDSHEKAFKLRYSLPDEEEFKVIKPKTYAYYCANKRVVETFRSKGLTVKLSAEEKQYGIFLLESQFFDDSIDDARNKIEIKGKDLLDSFSWDHINENLRPILKNLVFEKWPELEEKSERDKANLVDENPHLSSYIKTFDVVGRIEKDEALRSAVKRFEYAKKEVRNKYRQLLLYHKIDSFNIHEFQELAENTTELGRQELAEYIWYRKVVIDVMERLVDSREPSESVIHNLIMPMRSKDTGLVEDNNLWLLDDKFSLYQYAASDLEIDTIYKDVCGEVSQSSVQDGNDKPDISIFFSDSQDSPNDLETVIVELKKFTAKKYDIGKGLDQLPLYAESLKRRNPKFKTFWLYLVLAEFDEDYRRLISTSRNYKRFFSHDGEVYLQYNEDLNAHICVLTAKTLVANAKARNHKFLELVKSGEKM